jgi:hypothetical protein
VAAWTPFKNICGQTGLSLEITKVVDEMNAAFAER